MVSPQNRDPPRNRCTAAPQTASPMPIAPRCGNGTSTDDSRISDAHSTRLPQPSGNGKFSDEFSIVKIAAEHGSLVRCSVGFSPALRRNSFRSGANQTSRIRTAPPKCGKKLPHCGGRIHVRRSESMHSRYFPPCPVDGPIDPPVAFGHMGSRGAVPAKCGQCRHLFEGECTRFIETVGHYLHLDHGPCGINGPTDPVTYEDEFIKAKVEVPRKCSRCRFLAVHQIFGFHCTSLGSIAQKTQTSGATFTVDLTGSRGNPTSFTYNCHYQR